jgi:hypothetical protein
MFPEFRIKKELSVWWAPWEKINIVFLVKIKISQIKRNWITEKHNY